MDMLKKEKNKKGKKKKKIIMVNMFVMDAEGILKH